MPRNVARLNDSPGSPSSFPRLCLIKYVHTENKSLASVNLD
ncbi:hypothetical protein SS05631_b51060 (plasmid) [Sinorhizobium sp. CCBAU 05631]|nr:hypothetical protein SS05631_b51060 [Sinorhizobium sp. CCBAU 05631]